MKLASHIECTGCGACVSVCVKGCIQMKIAENGFFYPKVNLENCVDCGLCTKNCHVLNEVSEVNNEKNYYCGWHSSDKKRLEGSSGGIFGALAESFISEGGIVYGAAFSDDKKSLKHTSTHEVGVDKLLKSKYVESEMGDIIRSIKNDLKNGLKVLFCGTPCQVYGVRKVFGYKYENLLICDFLCHGVPSQTRYQLYIKELEEKYKSKISNIGFRTKKYGWKTYCIVVDFENGKQYVRLANEDPYYKQFFSNVNLRTTCYSCNRVSYSKADITLGDFWNARKKGYKDDDKGISLVVCNTKLGNRIINNLDNIIIQSVKPEDVSYAFSEHSLKENKTLEHDSFFNGFSVNVKDRLICMILKSPFFRNWLYRIK